MPRWIAFDQKTVEQLRTLLPCDQVFEHRARSIAAYAMGGPKTLVTILPLDSSKQAAVAVFRQRGAQPKLAVVGARSSTTNPGPRIDNPPPPAHARLQRVMGQQPAQVRPGGVLGLRDEAVFEEERQPPEKKTWWRRFWDEDE